MRIDHLIDFLRTHCVSNEESEWDGHKKTISHIEAGHAEKG